jgi:hypothetical protein
MFPPAHTHRRTGTEQVVSSWTRSIGTQHCFVCESLMDGRANVWTWSSTYMSSLESMIEAGTMCWFMEWSGTITCVVKFILLKVKCVSLSCCVS